MIHANCKVAHLFNLTVYEQTLSLTKSEQFESILIDNQKWCQKRVVCHFILSFEFWLNVDLKRQCGFAEETPWRMLEVEQSGYIVICDTHPLLDVHTCIVVAYTDLI